MKIFTNSVAIINGSRDDYVKFRCNNYTYNVMCKLHEMGFFGRIQRKEDICLLRRNSFKKIYLLSKPSIRRYVKNNELYRHNIGFVLINTNRGILTLRETVDKGIGGELILRYY